MGKYAASLAFFQLRLGKQAQRDRDLLRSDADVAGRFEYRYASECLFRVNEITLLLSYHKARFCGYMLFQLLQQCSEQSQ